MIIRDLALDQGKLCRMRATFVMETGDLPSVGGETAEVFFEWPAPYFAPVEPNPDVFAIAALPFALARGERLRLETPPISERLLLNLLEAGVLYEAYFPKSNLCPPLEARSVRHSTPRAPRIGSFYSGGVDSLYNIAEHRRLSARHGTSGVTDLWLVRGMDVGLANHALWEEVEGRLSGAQISEFRVASIATNLRDLQNGLVPWTETGFGPILGAIAKLFAPVCGTALIGSYGRFRDMIPHASTPLVDPLWSCDRQDVRHFTARASRAEKVATILRHAPEFLGALRVCYENRDGAYNCGECEKCMRTQMDLLFADPDVDLAVFARRIRPEMIDSLELPCDPKKIYAVHFWRDILAECDTRGWTAFSQAIRRALHRHERECRSRRRARRRRGFWKRLRMAR